MLLPIVDLLVMESLASVGFSAYSQIFLRDAFVDAHFRVRRHVQFVGRPFGDVDGIDLRGFHPGVFSDSVGQAVEKFVADDKLFRDWCCWCTSPRTDSDPTGRRS